MKSLIVRTLFMGCSPRTIQVNIDEDKSFKQLIDEHYYDLLPRPDRFATTHPYFFENWENLNETNVKYFNSCYWFTAFQSIKPDAIPVHLIDKIGRIKSDELTIASPGIRHDDSISFFLVEKYEQVLDTISTEDSRNPLKERLREFLEELLSETDSHILVDNYSRKAVEGKIASFVKQMIPSALWLELTKPSLSYYKRYILHFANQVLTLNYCVQHSCLEDRSIFKDISRGWIDDFLYRIQNLMLVLLNIPEAFLRSIYSSAAPAHYSELVRNIGIARQQERDDDYYSRYIVSKSISEVYCEILNDSSIGNYQDYIEFCESAHLSDVNLRRIVHTNRILFNKLKHSSYVEIIKSRDDEIIRKEELKAIEQEIKKLQRTQQVDTQDVSSELKRLSIRKEVIEKVRDAYAHLDFGDLQFKRNNGILVKDDKGTKFRITLYDLEISLKLLFGVLCTLNRANTTRAIQNAP